MDEFSDPGHLVEAAWLVENIDRDDLVVLDCSWHLPALGRDASAEFEARRIPGARYFDFDARVCDRGSALPHMLPGPGRFEAEVRRLGVGSASDVVCYDTTGIATAPRGWWMFKAFGHRSVAVLDGGLPAWEAAGGATESGASQAAPAGDFHSRYQASWVRDLAQVRRALEAAESVVLDARSAGRFRGDEPEPRAGTRSGHMPGALSLPFPAVLEGGRYRRDSELAVVFAGAGVGRDSELVFSCGSGVTACILALAAARAGYAKLAVYDGSWSEWGAHAEVPVVTGG